MPKIKTNLEYNISSGRRQIGIKIQLTERILDEKIHNVWYIGTHNKLF